MTATEQQIKQGSYVVLDDMETYTSAYGAHLIHKGRIYQFDLTKGSPRLLRCKMSCGEWAYREVITDMDNGGCPE